jgi:hypothetical protein
MNQSYKNVSEVSIITENIFSGVSKDIDRLTGRRIALLHRDIKKAIRAV